MQQVTGLNVGQNFSGYNFTASAPGKNTGGVFSLESGPLSAHAVFSITERIPAIMFPLVAYALKEKSFLIHKSQIFTNLNIIIKNLLTTAVGSSDLQHPSEPWKAYQHMQITTFRCPLQPSNDQKFSEMTIYKLSEPRGQQDYTKRFLERF